MKRSIDKHTRFVEGFNFRLTFRENMWPDLWTWVRAWCLPESKHPPLKQLKHTSTPKGLSCSREATNSVLIPSISN